MAGKVSGIFTAAMGGLDLYNIWALDSGLSTAQKGLKSLTKIAAIGAGVMLGGFLGAGAIAIGGGYLGAMAIGAGTILGSGLINLAETSINRRFGLGG